MTDSTGPLGYPTDAAERARILHAEGRFGGPQPGSGRPRVPRASELAAVAATEHAEIIVAALVAGVTEGSAEARARSATRWLTAAQREDAHVLHERRAAREDELSKLTIDELAERGTAVIMSGLRSGRIDAAALLAAAAKPEPADEVADAVVVPDD